jgi:GWxTD domain-containing protein
MVHRTIRLGEAALLLVSVVAVGSLFVGPLSVAADQGKRPATEKKEKLSREEKRRQKAAQKELETPYKKWLEEEVPYIITPDERASFRKLSTDEEREQFIEAFWERRNPNPGSQENEFKEEYYRRIAYANEHFASGIPGWKTDRGRIYIMYGPADEVNSHPSGGTYLRPQQEGGGQTETFPFEIWRYRYIEGIGENVELEFVDPTMTGEYHFTIDPGEKDALLHVPNAGLTDMEAMGMGSKANRFTRTDGMTIGQAMGGEPESMQEFTRLDLYSKIFKPPAVKLNDMRAVVTSRLSADLLPFEVRTDYLRVTEETVLTPVTVQVAHRELQFQNKDGVRHAALDIYGQVNNPAGRLITTFDEGVSLDVPEDEFQRYVTFKSVYQKTLPLKPGRYKLSVVVKDENSGRIGTLDLGLVVPHFDDEMLASSSLILADLIQALPTNQVGSGMFVIGDTKVRPSVNDTFTRSQKLGIFMQVYNLGIDPKTHRPSVDITYDITKDGKPVLDEAEDTSQWKTAVQQITLEKQLPLQSLAPGKYNVQIKVRDKVRNQTLSPAASFQLN